MSYVSPPAGDSATVVRTGASRALSAHDASSQQLSRSQQRDRHQEEHGGTRAIVNHASVVLADFDIAVHPGDVGGFKLSLHGLIPLMNG